MQKIINLPPLYEGIFYANLFAFALIGISSTSHWTNGVMVYSEFVLTPLLMGIISAWFWRREGFSWGQLIGRSCISGAVAILLSALFLKEGSICLIIVSPLLFGFMITGAFIGRYMFRKNNQRLNISLVSLLFVLYVADTLSTHHYENMVADQMVIHAPASEVWKHVVAFQPIRQKENFWLFQLGMPSPKATTVEGHFVGANRKCIFSNGYIFDEKIVTYDENNDLTFDITGQPRDPEIMGHIDILRGQFLLKDNGDGTTTLTGNSWYRLYVFPIWYYDIWAKSITRNVHLRVMEHIKKLSEKG